MCPNLPDVTLRSRRVVIASMRRLRKEEAGGAFFYNSPFNVFGRMQSISVASLRMISM